MNVRRRRMVKRRNVRCRNVNRINVRCSNVNRINVRKQLRIIKHLRTLKTTAN